MPIGTRIIWYRMKTRFVVLFVGSNLSPKDSASGDIFIFIVQNGCGES